MLQSDRARTSPVDDSALILDWISASVPCADDLAAEAARARAEVDDRVRAAHRLLIVLDDDAASCPCRAGR